MDLAHGELQDKTDSLAFGVLGNDPIKKPSGLGAISSLVGPSIVADFAVFINHPQTDDLITIVNKFVDQPLERVLRVIVLIYPDEERT